MGISELLLHRSCERAGLKHAGYMYQVNKILYSILFTLFSIKVGGLMKGIPRYWLLDWCV